MLDFSEVNMVTLIPSKSVIDLFPLLLAAPTVSDYSFQEIRDICEWDFSDLLYIALLQVSTC